jgi:hypothetical protein
MNGNRNPIRNIIPRYSQGGPTLCHPLYPFTVAGVGTGGYVATDMRNGTEGTVFSTYAEAKAEALLVLRFEEAVRYETLAPVCREHSPKP